MSNFVKAELYYNDNNLFHSETPNENKVLEKFIFPNSAFKIRVSVDDNSKNDNSSYGLKNTWDFGDGTIVVSELAEHYYSQPGKYRITCQRYKIENNDIDKNEFYIEVKEPVFTALNLNKRADLYPFKATNIGDLYGFVSSYFYKDIRIVPSFIDTQDKNYYWDLHKKPYYHLSKYYTFLKKDEGETEDLQMLYRLAPTEYYKPIYYNVYAYCTSKNYDITLYVLYDTNKNDGDDFCKAIQNHITVCDNCKITEILPIYDVESLPEYAQFIGKISKTPIWIKYDYQDDVTISFDFYEEDLIVRDDTGSAGSYINIPTTFYQLKNNISSKELKDCLSLNGLFANNFKNDEAHNFIVDSRLKENLYINKAASIYHAKYIKNDDEHLDMIKNEDIVISPIIIKQSDNNNIDNADIIEPKELPTTEKYYKIYNFTPSKKYLFILDNNGNLIFDKELVDLNEVIIPIEKNSNLDLDKLLSAYMQHPLFDETHNLYDFLKSIFGNKNMLAYAVSKGKHFLDDNINYKTCYLNSLLDILSMMGDDFNDYNINALNRSNELKELLRLLTMSYSDLFGAEIESYDIKISSNYKGKNISDSIEINDLIICGEDYKIIGIYKNNKIYKLKNPTYYIVLHDLHTDNTSLLNFINIESHNTFVDDSLKIAFPEIENFYLYRIDEYDKAWGWNLLLPENVYDYNNKGENIERYYKFYLFNPEVTIERKYNFVDESTIPMKNNKIISPEVWDNDFSTNCLMKVLTQTLL